MASNFAISTNQKQLTEYSSLDLVEALWQWGIRYLMVDETTNSKPIIELPELVENLAVNAEPRLREALIPLFIRTPNSDKIVAQVLADKALREREVIQHMYTAAAYLQRLWQGTLGIYLADIQLLPDLFGETKYNLPPPSEKYGEAGLRLLAAHFKENTGYDWLSTYDSVLNLFLQQLIQEERSNV